MASSGISKGTATAGTVHKVATWTISESAENREVQRTAAAGPNGENLASSSTAAAPAAVTLTTGNTSQIAVASGDKVGWLIVNVSGVTVYMGFDSSVSTSNGIPLFNNASYQQSGPGTFTGNVYCVAATNNKELRVQKW